MYTALLLAEGEGKNKQEFLRVNSGSGGQL